MFNETDPAEDRWDAMALPGDGLIACGRSHVVVVEMSDRLTDDGLVDEILAVQHSHRHVVGRAAAVSLRRALDNVLASHAGPHPAVAVASLWEDKAALTLYGRASASVRVGGDRLRFDGTNALVATDVVVDADFDELEIHVGPQPDPDVGPLSAESVTPGRGVRVVGDRRAECLEAEVENPLNEWVPHVH